MGKYIKLFQTHSAYSTYINGQDKILPNVSYCEDNNECHYNPLRNDIIVYNSSEKLVETTTLLDSGLHTNAFNTTIKSHTFENGIGKIEFNENVTEIGSAAFRICSGITSITLPNSVTSIGNVAFYQCTGLTSITIPNSVTTIGSHAFNGCSGLTNVIIPFGVTSIGERAFISCSSLTSVIIPNSVTTINGYAFQSCSGLTSVTIGNSVNNIKTQAFYDCSSLTSITLLSTTPPTLDSSSALTNTNDCPIYVPAESVTAYKAATNWSTYANRIQAIP